MRLGSTAKLVIGVMIVAVGTTRLSQAQTYVELGIRGAADPVVAELDTVIGDWLLYRAGSAGKRVHVDEIESMVPGTYSPGNPLGALIGGAAGLGVGFLSLLPKMFAGHLSSSAEEGMAPTIAGLTGFGLFIGFITNSFKPSDAVISFVGLTIEQRRALVERLILDARLREVER